MLAFAAVNILDFLHLIRCAMASHCCFNLQFCSDYDIILSQKKVKVKLFSRVRLFAIPRTVAGQAPLSMGFHRQEYWSGLQFLTPRDPPDPGIKPGSPALQAVSLPSEPPRKLREVN